MILHYFSKIKVWDLAASLDPRAPSGTLCIRTLVVSTSFQPVGLPRLQKILNVETKFHTRNGCQYTDLVQNYSKAVNYMVKYI